MYGAVEGSLKKNKLLTKRADKLTKQNDILREFEPVFSPKSLAVVVPRPIKYSNSI